MQVATKPKIVIKRNRHQTIQTMLNAFEEAVLRRGVERAGINAVMEISGKNKVLAYRYFGSWNGLLEEYVVLRYSKLAMQLATLPDGATETAYLKTFSDQLQEHPAWLQLFLWQQKSQQTAISQRLVCLQEASLATAGFQDRHLLRMQLIMGGIIDALCWQQPARIEAYLNA